MSKLVFSQSDSLSKHQVLHTLSTSYDSGFVVIKQIEILGNKITKSRIILREIPFKVNDTISKPEIKSLLKESRENMLNTSLFNFVTVETIPAGNYEITVLVTVAERWYTWPSPIFEVQERNFNVWWQTKNFKRVNYGLLLNRENFRGRKEDLSFSAQFGYTQKFGITYNIPYISKKQIGGIGISFSYSQNHEVAYQTYDNKVLYYKNPDHSIREELGSKIGYTYRSGIHNTHSIDARFIKSHINDTLLSYTTGYFIGQDLSMEYFMLNYYFRSEFRNSRMYPLTGYYFDFEATKMGLGILSDEKLNAWNFTSSFKYYYKLSNRFYTSFSTKVKYSPTWNQPYAIQQGLGWKDYVRSYEYYVIDGQRYILSKLGVKYEILKPRIQTIPHMPFKKFNTFHYALYAALFSDAGYVVDKKYALVNPLANKFLNGYGVGLDFVTYYDIVVSFEYSINRMREHGFFIHFNAGI